MGEATNLQTDWVWGSFGNAMVGHLCLSWLLADFSPKLLGCLRCSAAFCHWSWLRRLGQSLSNASELSCLKLQGKHMNDRSNCCTFATDPQTLKSFCLAFFYYIYSNLLTFLLHNLLRHTSFPVHIRVVAMGISYNISAALFGGPTPYICSQLLVHLGTLTKPFRSCKWELLGFFFFRCSKELQLPMIGSFLDPHTCPSAKLAFDKVPQASA